jgi:predicted nucleic acid-binding protein
MAEPSFTPEEVAACRELLLRLTHQPLDWPTHDPAFQEIVKLAARLTQLAKKLSRKIASPLSPSYQSLLTTIRFPSGLTTGSPVRH